MRGLSGTIHSEREWGTKERERINLAIGVSMVKWGSFVETTYCEKPNRSICMPAPICTYEVEREKSIVNGA